jgi:hypothetical protein
MEALQDVVLSTRTPFVNETSLSMAEIWRGRIRFSGVSRVNSMENMLLGLPASGGLPAWSVTGQSHAGLWTPEDASTYGLSLTFRSGTPLGRGAIRSRLGKGLARLILDGCT